MSGSSLNIKITKKNKEELNREILQKMSQEELIEKIIGLKAYNLQLKNILQRKKSETNLDTQPNTTVKKKVDFEKASMRHVFLKFLYLGWNCQGYVSQEDTNNTIEYFLFHALKKCCLIQSREKSNYHRCGRTDKGVSAFSQVVSIDLRSKVSEPSESNLKEEYPYCSMLNRVLPSYIRCYAWAHVGSNISSRFDCSLRTYKYYFPKGNLNLDAMLEGAKFLIGTHDFRNLCKMDVGNGVVNFQREVTFVDIKECFSSSFDMSGYKMYEFIIQAKSFLWHQIRCIMSVLILIGQEKESPDVIKHLLNTKENPNKPQYSMANHLPLILYDVNYENISLQWHIDELNLTKTLESLYSLWVQNSVKCTMIRDVIERLQNFRNQSIDLEKLVEPLLDGVKAKVYKPLLTRMTCESLENKIKRYVKKRKLELIEAKDELCGIETN